MILETLACSDFSRKPQYKAKQGKKKGSKAPGGKKPSPKLSVLKAKAKGPTGLKMDAKNVHSRAYHRAYKVAKTAGKTSADCRDAAQKAAKEAVANM